MLKDVCVSELTGRGKKCFKSRRAAERAARNSPIKLYTYNCRYCQAWHHTHQPQKFKTVAPPSLKTLRRWIDNQTKVLAACERRVQKAEQRLAAEKDRAQQREAAARAEHAIELEHIRKMTERLTWR